MLFDPPLGNADHLRELKGRQSGSCDQLHDLLPRCQGLLITHKKSYARTDGNESAFLRNPLDLEFQLCHHLTSGLWFVLILGRHNTVERSRS